MIYGIEFKEAFDNYQTNTALAEKFIEQRESFIHHMRIDRWHAAVVGLLTTNT